MYTSKASTCFRRPKAGDSELKPQALIDSGRIKTVFKYICEAESMFAQQSGEINCSDTAGFHVAEHCTGKHSPNQECWEEKEIERGLC